MASAYRLRQKRSECRKALAEIKEKQKKIYECSNDMQDLLSISNFYQIDELSADKNLIKNTKLEIADMGDILNNTKKNLEDEIDELTERINEIEDDD